MTDAEFIAWLKSDSAVRCVLVEVVVNVGGVETTRYLSNRGYVTGAGDTPAHTLYEPRINGGCVITETLAIDSSDSTMTFGDVQLDNTEGEIDSWFDDIWRNRALRMYVGDMRWARSDFRLVFNGQTSDIDSSDRTVLNIKARDKLQQLNTSVSEVLLGGSSSNANRLIPIVIGEVHNMTPLLTNKSTLEYQVNLSGGVTERVIEGRDEGVVLNPAPTVDLYNGKITLNASLKGTLTFSVQGMKYLGTYANTVANCVSMLATQFGKTPFSSSDLDAANLSVFNATNTQPVGRLLTDRENVLQVCLDLAASIGAQVCMSATGLLRLLRIDLAGTSPTAVSAKNMREKTLEMRRRLPVIAGVKLNYCKNWTVQEALRTGIPAEHKDLYQREWLVSTATDSVVADDYGISTDVEAVDTYLLTKATADAEALRRLNLWKVQRHVWGYEGMPELMLEELGGYQTITHSRYGMSGGKTVQIVQVARDWLEAKVTFEVLG
jgi:hypothetical protein